MQTETRHRPKGDLRERAPQKTSLHADVSLALAEPASERQILQKVTDAVMRWLPAAFVRIWMANLSTNTLELQASSGLYTHLNGSHSRVPIGEYKIGRIAERRTPHLTNDVLRDPQISDPAWAKEQGMVAFAGYPLLVEGQLLGVLALFAREALPDDTLEALEIVADLVAQGVQRKRTEDTLRRSEERYRAFITQSSEAIWRFEFDPPIPLDLPADEQVHRAFECGALAECNDAMARMYGFNRADEILGKPIKEFLQMSEPELLEYGRAFVNSGYRLTDVETAERDRHGKTVYFQNSMVGIFEGRQLARIWGTQRDITERKRMEDALQHNEQQLRLMADATPGLISYIDSDCRYRFANQQYSLWFGLNSGEIVGKTMTEVLGATAMERLRPYIDRALAGEKVHFETEVFYRHAGQRWIDVHYVPRRDNHDQVVGFFVLVLDISERKRVESDLAEAHRQLARHAENLEQAVSDRTARLSESLAELETFSYSLSHDMRAPLRAIQSYSEVVLAEAGEKIGAPCTEYLERIVAAAERMDRLIQDVLAYGRMSRQEMEMKPLDTEKLISDIIQERPELQSTKADIEIRRPLLPVVGHAASLTQCVTNLLSNAVKFVGQGVRPHVRISSELREGCVRLWFEDNGIGIEDDAQHRIFELFYRHHNNGGNYEGTGVGLAIVRKAAERMGGQCGVESRPHQGSRFWIQLRRAG